MGALSIHVRTRAWCFGYRVGLFISRFRIPSDAAIAAHLPRWLLVAGASPMTVVLLRVVLVTLGQNLTGSH
jgi:hypothetical protein